MYIKKVWSYGKGIHSRNPVIDGSALQSGMDCCDYRFLSCDLPVGLAYFLGELGIRIWCPCRISSSDLHLETITFKKSLDFIGKIKLAGLNRGPYGIDYRYILPVHGDYCHVVAGLHHSLESHGPASDAGRGSEDGVCNLS